MLSPAPLRALLFRFLIADNMRKHEARKQTVRSSQLLEIMLNPFAAIFRNRSKAVPLPSVPAGERYYVIGDVHGRRDLFAKLIEAIDEDDRQAGVAATTVVLLGDLVDRGPDSAGVIADAIDWQERRTVRCLAGNHEEMFLDSFTDTDVLRHFVKHGGRETIMSYGVERKRYNALSLDELQETMNEVVPQQHRDFLESFEEMIIAGDYAFVHAGIDPKRAIDEQKRKDLLWIRDRFLSHEGALSHVVVHGHTIFDEVVDHGNRIGIDTGAYRSGKLTALVLEGDLRRYIQTVDNGDHLSIEKVD